MWNCFDFFLVVLGFMGLIMSFLALDQKSAASQTGSESRVIRIARVLRTMRFLRLFRLFHARLSADKHVSPEVVAVMKSMSTMKSFIRAHLDSQEMILLFFTDSIDESNELELARCVVQSQISVHNAVLGAVNVYRRDKELFEDIRLVLDRKHIVEDLQEFIESALADGAISTTNAGLILHPMAHEVHDCIAYIYKKGDGIDTVNPATDGFGDYGNNKLSTRSDSFPSVVSPPSLAVPSPKASETESADAAAGVRPAKAPARVAQPEVAVSVNGTPDASPQQKVTSPDWEALNGDPLQPLSTTQSSTVSAEGVEVAEVARASKVSRFKSKPKKKVVKKRAADERQADEALEETEPKLNPKVLEEIGEETVAFTSEHSGGVQEAPPTEWT